MGFRDPFVSSPAKAGDPVAAERSIESDRGFTDGRVITGCPAFAGHDTAE
jgi:hypothetical protein